MDKRSKIEYYKTEPNPNCPSCKSSAVDYINCFAHGINAFKCRVCYHEFSIKENIKRN